MSSNRSNYWDNIKGILIFLVVFAHFLLNYTGNYTIDLIVGIIYTFHMPAFVFVSGYFTKPKPHIRKLVYAFIIFQSAFIIYEFIHSNTVSILSPYYVCWYLLALIVWRLLAKYLPKKIYLIPVLFILSILTGFVSGIQNILGLTRILSFLVFFAAGYLLSEDNIKLIKEKISPFYGLLVLFTAGVCSFTAKEFFNYSISDYTMMEYSTPRMVIGRAVLLLLAFMFIIALITVVPDKGGILSKIGKNSMSIFLLHRFITFIYYELVGEGSDLLIISSSLLLTVLTVLVLGSDKISGLLESLLSGNSKDVDLVRRIIGITLASGAIVVFLTYSITNLVPISYEEDGNETTDDTLPVYRLITASQEDSFDNAIRIVFSGDLILLEDQVRLAYDLNSDSYDFSPLFEYTRDEIGSADLAIGVYEGPSGGEDIGYSSGNFDDGKGLTLNFPDEFAAAVADAGFDLVTTANNHILDKGLEAALRTNEVLDTAGLMHIGTYSGGEDKNESRVQIIEVKGLKVAVLAYTYGSNFHTDEEFFDGEYSTLTSVIVSADSPYYDRALQQVEDDFEYCHSLEPDLIIVLPHMGTQFADDPDEFQMMWRDTFIELGADVVLGDHSHSVQPVCMEEVEERMTFTAYCPGNYTNIFRGFNGDASALIEVFIDPDSHSVIGGGIIPMWTTAHLNGNYRPIPIWDIVNDEELAGRFTVDDFNRVVEVHEHITNIMLGTPISVDLIEPDYLLDENGFIRRRCDQLDTVGEMEQSAFLTSFAAAESVCFVGDSITCGTKNGGVPWYEPISGLSSGSIYNLSYGGWTTLDIINHIEELPEAQMYVIAIGTNDLRYDNDQIGATVPEDYISNITIIRDRIRQISPDSSIWFIAPWISYDGDQVSPLSIDEINNRRDDFSEALRMFCEESGDYYIDPNTYIDEVISRHTQSEYLLDWIHPNVSNGVELYSEAVVMSSNYT
ncbi:MAG: CapA family protein [Clostridiales bacterium]|nr:CapA family protein [Clostridiales bacterium]